MMELHLPPDIETMLREHAAARHIDINDLAIESIRENLSVGDLSEAPELSNDEWKRRLRNWSLSHPRQQHHVDTSRDSIYRGRGE